MSTKVKRGLCTALIVGTILNLINQWDALLIWSVSWENILQMAITPIVPFVVSYSSSWLAERHHIRSNPVTESLREVANGNLSPKLEDTKNELFDSIIQVLRLHLKNLKRNLSAFFHNSYDIAAVSGCIRQHSDSLEERSEVIQKSNSEVSQLLSDLAKVTRQVSEVTGRSKEIQKVVASNLDQTRSVADLFSKIEELVNLQNHHCQEIQKFSKGISDLTFQSKMLSFNASVEAARAGEAGKGFSVVALEINNLSQQSKERTDEIQEKTENLIKSIGNLVHITAEASEANKAGGVESERISQMISDQSDEIQKTHDSISRCMKQVDQIGANMAGLENFASYTQEVVSKLKDESIRLQDGAQSLRQHIKTYKGVTMSQPKDVLEFNIKQNIPVIRALLQKSGVPCDFVPPDLDSRRPEKTPADVYRMLSECYSTIQSRLSLPEIQKIEGLEILPSDVYRLSNEINHVLTSTTTDRAPIPEAEEWLQEILGTKTIKPSDVYMCVSIVHEWVHSMEKKAGGYRDFA